MTAAGAGWSGATVGLTCDVFGLMVLPELAEAQYSIPFLAADPSSKACLMLRISVTVSATSMRLGGRVAAR